MTERKKKPVTPAPQESAAPVEKVSAADAPSSSIDGQVGTYGGVPVVSSPAPPPSSAPIATQRQIVAVDARNRSWRTLLQGLGIDVVAAILAAINQVFDPATGPITWSVVGVLVGKSVVQALLAYVMRLRVSPMARTPEGNVELTTVPVPVPAGQA